jgi:hypothetical protein
MLPRWARYARVVTERSVRILVLLVTLDRLSLTRLRPALERGSLFDDDPYYACVSVVSVLLVSLCSKSMVWLRIAVV